VARHLAHDRGGRTVIDGASVTIGPDTRMGVVGPNGVGKSTLLQLLAGLIEPDAGEIVRDPPSATVGYLAQEHEAPSGETVRQNLGRRTGSSAAEAELAEAAAGLAAGGAAAERRYEVALERFTGLGVGDLDARIDAVLEEIGLGTALADQPVSTLSGGQRAKVALAGTELSHFDLTLLDEPTNDLDFEGLARLERWIRSLGGGLVVVSHDRDFLGRTVSTVLELDEHTRTGHEYGGGWDGYEAERANVRRHATEAYELYQRQRGQLESRAERQRRWATTGVRRESRQPRDNDKAQRDFRINRTEKLAAKARQTDRAREALEVVAKPWEGWDLRFTIEEAARAGTVVARLTGAVIERGLFRMGPLDLEIVWGDRVALTGPNGSGKSSLVAALLGHLPLVSGRQWLGPSVVAGELGQDRRTRPGRHDQTSDDLVRSTMDRDDLVRSTMDRDDLVRSTMDRDDLVRSTMDRDDLVRSTMDRCGLTQAEARSLLAKFGLGAEHVTRPVGTLSPGERTRAELAAFQALGVNLLVLDEPTNHLDLPAIEQLEAALASFGGTLLLVSHDRHLLASVEVTRSIELPWG
jgi:ATPase subunit of ABC transporter with duplicated ATPase domains